jgi:hypothetical protein
MEKLQNETAMYTRLVYIDTVGHDYNRPVQKCSFSDPRRALVYGRFLGILFILSFCHRQFFLFK